MAHRRDAGGPEAMGDLGVRLSQTNNRMIKLLAFLSVAFAAIIADSVSGSEKVERVPPDTSPTPTEKAPRMQEKRAAENS